MSKDIFFTDVSFSISRYAAPFASGGTWQMFQGCSNQSAISSVCRNIKNKIWCFLTGVSFHHSCFKWS